MTLDEARKLANPPPPYRPPPNFTGLHVATAAVLLIYATYDLPAAVSLALVCLLWRAWMARVFRRK